MSDKEEVILSDAVKKEIDQWVKKFPPEQKRSALLYALRVVQEERGWLSEPAMVAVADYLGLPHITAFEVATFYGMYDLHSRGRNKIGVCNSISCMLCGSHKIASYLQDKLKVGFNESTEDGKFYLQEVECLAACKGAPAIIVNDREYHEDMTPEKIDRILENLE